MKTLILTLAAMAPASAFAHGLFAHQASEAVDSAAKMFMATQDRPTQGLFQSIGATRTGVEQFAVVITLTNRAQFNYSCHENEGVNPPVWECVAK